MHSLVPDESVLSCVDIGAEYAMVKIVVVRSFMLYQGISALKSSFAVGPRARVIIAIVFFCMASETGTSVFLQQVDE